MPTGGGCHRQLLYIDIKAVACLFSSKRYSPRLTAVIISLLLWPGNGGVPDNSMKAMTPTDLDMDDCKSIRNGG